MQTKLFSKHFKIDPAAFDEADLLDAYVPTDTPLFIDPLLIDKSSNETLRTEGLAQFRHYFENVVRLLSISEREGDEAWRGAERLLSLKEPAENGLGYSRGARAGTGRPKDVRRELLRTIRNVIRLGSKDPEMLSLMGFLEPGIGPDTISDFTTVAMSDALAKLTNVFCSEHGVALFPNSLSEIPLPLIVRNGKTKPLVLVPRDVLRDLPVTDSWSDVWAAAEHNQALRDKLSIMLAGIAQPTITQQKEAVKEAVLQSSATFDAFLSAVKDAAAAYDPNLDVKGFYAFRDALRSNPNIKAEKDYDFRKKPEDVLSLILDALRVFKHNVENGNLWEELWAGEEPKRERASQLLFFAIADAYCQAYKLLNISEPNFGGGPVDFVFADGCDAKVIVELKRSTGSVVNGYEKQLERYKLSARTDYAVFVVMDYGRPGGAKKIRDIHRLRERQLERGEKAAEIVVIDCTKKDSPSKLR